MKTNISSLLLCLTVLLSACQTQDAPQPTFECTDHIGCVEIAPGEPIKIGVMQSLDTSKTPGGLAQLQSIELAISQHKEQIIGHPIELQVEDSQCSAEGGTIAALKIAADPQIVGILGTTCSGAAALAAKIVSDAGLVMISGLNTAPSLTKLHGLPGENWQPGYFRTIYNGAQLARAAATFAFQELKITRAATIDDGDIYSQELAREFNEVFAELGGELVFSGVINENDPNMEPILTAVAASGAEALYLPVFIPEAVLIVHQARVMDGFDDITLLGGEVLGSQAFIDAVGSDGIGMYILNAETPSGSAYDLLLSDYEARFGEPAKHHGIPSAFDAANLLLNAIEAVAVQSPDGTVSIGRAALRDELYAPTEFDGVTGQLSCTEFGDCRAIRFVVLFLEEPHAGLDGLLSNIVFTSEPPKEHK